jgi:DNA-binding HxlR family transcriptional regulator
MPGIYQRNHTHDHRPQEEAGLVNRTVYPTAPIKVEYELTQDGERLKPVVGVMKEFGLWVKGKAPI